MNEVKQIVVDRCHMPAIAQLVEHLTVECCSNQMVPGSIPVAGFCEAMFFALATGDSLHASLFRMCSRDVAIVVRIFSSGAKAKSTPSQDRLVLLMERGSAHL